MDSQLFSNFFAGLSALAAIISAICAFIAWYQSIGSKKAKAEAEERARQAEERARQAEELLAQMSDIASSLRRPILELVHENKNHPDHERYRLRNNIGHPVTILEVMNLQEFFVRYCDIPELPAEVHRGNPVNFSLPHDVTVKSLELRIKVSGKEETLFVEIPR